MTAVAQVLEEVRWHVLNGRRDLVTTVAADINATTTTVTIPAALTGLAAGQVLECGLELMYVSAYAGATSVTVVRGYAGTSPAAHYAGDILTVNPTVPAWLIMSKINATLAMMSAPQNALARMAYLDLTTTTSKLGYDFPALDGFRDVWVVKQRVDNIGGWRKVPCRARLMRDADVADFPSGNAIVFDEPLLPFPTRIWYRCPFDTVNDWGDDIEGATGLPSTAVDVVTLGATILSVEGREISHANRLAQPDPRRPGEVTAGGATNSTARMGARFNQRLMEEGQRFLALWEEVR